ncbi:MAG: hypothetical protein HC929_16415 [Leptolyngbyaceae cyanobacterium SM2_5_2]|nr:hypothetical protein [Leptolyngbyaceae cyanobacterium SM2_5_2]
MPTFILVMSNRMGDRLYTVPQPATHTITRRFHHPMARMANRSPGGAVA